MQQKRRKRRRFLVPMAAANATLVFHSNAEEGECNNDSKRLVTENNILVNTGANHTIRMTTTTRRIRTRARKQHILLSPSLFLVLVTIALFQTVDPLLVRAFCPSPGIESISYSRWKQSIGRPRFLSTSFLKLSTVTPPKTVLPSRAELESMKVVDLKELIKDSGLNERGLFSRLKRKQDLVDFLVQAGSREQQTTTAAAKEKSQIISDQPKEQQTQPKTRRKPLGMPSKKSGARQDAATTTTTANKQQDTGTASHNAVADEESLPLPKSPLQVIYDRVHEQYPPLKYLSEGNNTLLGEQDIRQKYHPMLQHAAKAITSKRDKNNKDQNDDQDGKSDDGESETDDDTYTKPALSGDMDLIFVGTASCTPSITRGVSCTALRLHSLAKQQTQSANVRVDARKPSKGNTKQSGKNFDVAQNSQSNLGTWLFDCGESTQLQIQKTSSVRPSKITKIFLSHAHGDHSFGLPGLLCLMGQDSEGKGTKAPVDIYGPEGLRLWLRSALRYSVSRICPKYRVHELKDVSMAPEWGYSRKWERYFFNKSVWYERQKGNQNTGSSDYYWGAANHRRSEYPPSSDWLTHCETGGTIKPSELYGEVEGGRDIYPIYDHPLSSDGAPVWEVESGGGDGVRVYAAPMSHGIPCVGYVVQEPNRPGRLRDELVKPICQRNIPALKEAGFRHPMKAMAVIKDLPKGGSFTFPDGTVVTQEDAVEPARPGRKVVVLGDTNSARSMERLAQNADVVVHEATNTFLPALEHKDATFSSVTKDTIFHGHSTPNMAGDFCKRVGAKRLILNHFSARYTGDQSMDSISIMTRIEEQAIKASGLTRNDVAAAWDFMIYPVPKAEGVAEEA
ncbi:unnamed protein product [Pseudo-nitzschia multistriata]|uniref:Metallo-beta-lactamase domain-containing protein n=1 Tax=Pseudo-nitzschia multistriata TaxID=183589 RepID=A0A448ZE25_9STRA|nr:unnamed protein product [Pseudo-nitzschia multistriata]